jgi:hypothetical protein
MTDEEHARAIADAETALNAAIVAASDAGLRLDFATTEYHPISNMYPVELVSITALRPLAVK